jgi:carboxypeptidase C (cathepsin A)
MRIVFLLLFFSSYLFTTDFPKIDGNLKSLSHSVRVNGVDLKYNTTTGTLPIKVDNPDSPFVNIFFVSYSLENEGLENRPITFVFNGGPGSSSIWLHFGAFGPKKISFQDELNPDNGYSFKENEQTLLQFTDLVFIDPFGTGFSHVEKNSDFDNLYSLEGDAKVIGDFICKYLTLFDKWLSKKFIAGESYGTVRAACCAEYLQDDLGVYLDGLSLISPVIKALHCSDASEEAYPLLLPTYAATAWFHKLLSPTLQEKTLTALISEVKSFALNEYTLALVVGDQIDENTKKEVIRKLSQYTGISEEVIKKNNLRLNVYIFASSILQKDNSTDLNYVVGLHDTRIKGFCRSIYCENPSLDSILGIYSLVANDYFHSELGYFDDDPYVILNLDAHSKWKWEKEGQKDFQSLNISSTLRHILMVNPHLKIFVASGYYDLATPFQAAEYDLNHLYLPVKLKSQIEFHTYESGHMIYLNEKMHQNLTKDLVSFFNLRKH